MWDEQLASGARDFFLSAAGREFLKELNSYRPEISGSTIEEKAMSASVLQGYELSAKEIVRLYSFRNQVSTDQPKYIKSED